MEPSVGPSDELLRKALELALAVAQAGQRVRPPLTPPASLRALLRFQKLPTSALGQVRRAVEDDDEFRQRVASVATEEIAGAAGVLWLTRPDGWAEELDRLAHEEGAADERREADRQERSAVKRVEAAEQAAAKARAEQAVAVAEAARERERRQAAEAGAADAAERVRRLESDLVAARAEARSARDQLASARSALDEAALARRTLTEERDALRLRLDEALRARVDAEARAGASVGNREAPGVAAAVTALRDAAAAMSRVAAALGDAAGATGAAGGDAPGRTAATSTGARRGRPARTPLSIPGGLYVDAPEVAAHLLRVPDVVVVVDGYNVAKTGWPDLDLATQRERLLDTLEDLVRRTGTRIHVVFDGADVAVPATGRRLVHVRFSPPGVSADDIIREFVAELPTEQAVVVVTSDNAVVASVRAMGANTIASTQLLAALTR